MSQYSQHVSQFILNSLSPEIDRLNVELSSMEEFGYDSKEIRDKRKRVNKLVPVFDFLNEYIVGDEECDFSILRNLISMTGLGVLSSISQQPKVLTTSDANKTATNPAQDDKLIVYIGSDVYDGSIVNTGSYTLTFIGNSEIDSISVSKNGGSAIVSSKPVVKLINTSLPIGINSFAVNMTKNGVLVYTKTITIQAQ